MPHSEAREDVARDPVVANGSTPAETTATTTGRDRARWEARFDLERYRAETERLKVLVEFLGHPVHAHGGADPDPDIVTAYNLAVEAALLGIRRASAGG